MTSRTPNVFFIGAGAVASALATAFRKSGVPVLGLWARGDEPARYAAAISGVQAYSGSIDALPSILSVAEVIVVAVRDEAISEVALALAKSEHVAKNAVILHCSGVHAAHTVLAPLVEQGSKVRAVGTLHPLRSFSDSQRAAAALRDTTFALEGDPVATEAARELVRRVGGRVIELSAADLPAYHAAAVLASNGLVALLATAAETLKSLGLPRERALDALLPLAQGTLDNLATVGLPGALTGPVLRGDASTVAKNIGALPASDARAIYLALAQVTVALARERGTTSADLTRISEVLNASKREG